jgi:hypothetical protein
VHLSHLPLGIFCQLSCKGFLARRAERGFPLELKNGNSYNSTSSAKDIAIIS